MPSSGTSRSGCPMSRHLSPFPVAISTICFGCPGCFATTAIPNELRKILIYPKRGFRTLLRKLLRMDKPTSRFHVLETRQRYKLPSRLTFVPMSLHPSPSHLGIREKLPGKRLFFETKKILVILPAANCRVEHFIGRM